MKGGVGKQAPRFMSKKILRKEKDKKAKGPGGGSCLTHTNLQAAGGCMHTSPYGQFRSYRKTGRCDKQRGPTKAGPREAQRKEWGSDAKRAAYRHGGK